LALINSSYENKLDRARAIGVWGGIGGFAAAAGPAIGAFLTAWFGWRAVFFVNIPIGMIGVVLTINHVKNSRSGHIGNFDFLGQCTGIISIASLAFSLIEAGRLGWLSATVMSGLGFFLLTLIVFILIEHRNASPMLPLIFFKSKTFSTSIAVGMIINIGVYGIFFLLPLYFQHVRSYSVFMTGLAITPLSALAGICSYFSGRLVGIIGSRIMILIGLSIGSIGFFMLLMAGEHTPYILLLVPFALIGVGGSLTMPAATIATINSVPEGRAGIASGAFNTSRQIGSLVGVAIFGTLINQSIHFIDGMHSSLVIAGVLFIVGCVAALLWVEL